MRSVFVRVEPHLRIAFVEPHVDRHCRRGTTPADRLSRNWTPHLHVAFVDTETYPHAVFVGWQRPKALVIINNSEHKKKGSKFTNKLLYTQAVH
jgi:hypothetical protein